MQESLRRFSYNCWSRSFLLFLLIMVVLASASIQVHADNGESSLVRLEIVTYPVHLPIMVNNILYTPSSGGSIIVNVPAGSSVTISVLEDEYYSEPGTRYVFTGWNYGGSSKSIILQVNSTMTVVALYEKQYYVEVVSPYGSPIGSGWYREGARVNFSVDDVVYLDNKTRAVFEFWNLGERPESNNENYLYVFEPAKVVASWHLEYKLALKYNAVKANPVLIGSGWYREGTAALIEAPSSINITNSERLVFSKWSVVEGTLLLENPSNPKQLVPINEPITLVANYDLYYYVDVRSPHGQVDGSGFYKNGSKALITIVEAEEAGSNGIRYVFKQWSGDVVSNKDTILIQVTKPMTIFAEWKKQYQLSIDSQVPAVKGDGWYDAGSKAKISAVSEVKSRFGVKYVFKGWTGDYKGLETSATVLMDSPKHVIALWEKDYTGLYVTIMGTIFLLAAIVAGYKYVLKPKLLGKTVYETEEDNESS